MSRNVFLDTNVIIDFLDKERLRHNDAVELLEYLIVHDIEIFISEDILTTLFYILKDKKNVLKFFGVIARKWNIVPFGLDVIERSIELSMGKEIDFEDLMQCLCAKKHNCTQFITNDKTFYDCGVQILTTKEFLELDKSC